MAFQDRPTNPQLQAAPRSEDFGRRPDKVGANEHRKVLRASRAPRRKQSESPARLSEPGASASVRGVGHGSQNRDRRVGDGLHHGGWCDEFGGDVTRAQHEKGY